MALRIFLFFITVFSPRVDGAGVVGGGNVFFGKLMCLCSGASLM